MSGHSHVLETPATLLEPVILAPLVPGAASDSGEVIAPPHSGNLMGCVGFRVNGSTVNGGRPDLKGAP